MPLEVFQYLTRIHYKAGSNSQWGEHEIDHILILRRDVDVKVNLNEVKATKYVCQEELKEFFGKHLKNVECLSNFNILFYFPVGILTFLEI